MLDTIDDNLDDVGILFVTTADTGIAEEFGVVDYPSVGIFRNGHFLEYPDELNDEKELLKWLTDEDTLKILGVIDEVNMAMLENILEEEEDVFALFYKENYTDIDVIMEELEQIDESFDEKDITMVKISDQGAADAFGIHIVPVYVHFTNGIPEIFQGDLEDRSEVFNWMSYEIQENIIIAVNREIFEKLIERKITVTAIFYDAEKDNVNFEEFTSIFEEMRSLGFHTNFIKVNDPTVAAEYGLDELPALLFIEDRIPSLYTAPPERTAIIEWLIEQNEMDIVKVVTDEMIKAALDDGHLAVYFSGTCEEECEKTLDELDSIAYELKEFGIHFVTTEERGFAKQNEVNSFPALVLFRNDDALIYEGDLDNEQKVYEWITNHESLQAEEMIETVSFQVLKSILKTEDDVMLFLYREGSQDDAKILIEFQRLNDLMEEAGIMFVKCHDRDARKVFGKEDSARLIHFHDYIPNFFDRNFEEVGIIQKWIQVNQKVNNITGVSSAILDFLVGARELLGVVFTNTSDSLERLNRDITKLRNTGIPIIRVSESDKVYEYGMKTLPRLVLFKDRIPGMYFGELNNIAGVVSWLEAQKESSPRPVNHKMLHEISKESEYVLVFFAGDCRKVPECRENIADIKEINAQLLGEVEDLGITFVEDVDAAGVGQSSGDPTFGLYRNGKIIVLDTKQDKLMDEIIKEENLFLDNVIEKVNAEMLDHMVETQDELLVLFGDEEGEDEEEIEDIETEMKSFNKKLESDGINFVICTDGAAAREYGLPTNHDMLVFFADGIPIVYRGNLEEVRLAMWVEKVQELDVIDVEKNIFDSVVERLDYVAVFLYSENNEKDKSMIHSLKEIAVRAKDYDILFLASSDPKIHDSVGVTELPSLVYFESETPSLYTGSFLSKMDDLLDWLIVQRTSATIEEVNDNMLQTLIRNNEYVAVLFLGVCHQSEYEVDDGCQETINNLERIDADLDEQGITFVKTTDTVTADVHWVYKFPCVGLFRNEEFIKFEGDPKESSIVLSWLTHRQTIEIPGKIEKVNSRMLSRLITARKDIHVFLYKYSDAAVDKIIYHLEEYNDILEDRNIPFVKAQVDEDYILEYDEDDLPTLIHYKAGDPHVFFGKFNRQELNKWFQMEVNGDDENGNEA